MRRRQISSNVSNGENHRKGTFPFPHNFQIRDFAFPTWGNHGQIPSLGRKFVGNGQFPPMFYDKIKWKCQVSSNVSIGKIA